jgi:hypothetical protein
MPGHPGTIGRREWFGPDSLTWLFLVTALFILAELLPALLRLPLGADEITYIAKTSAHASGVVLPPVHGHGVGLLAAPVTLLTTSLSALRIWMAVLSGAGLLLSLLCWRGLRPAWQLALAAFIFGSLAITQLSGVQVYPDLWAAFGAVAITGLLLQSFRGRMQSRILLPLIAFVAFFIILLRPQNVVFVLGPAFIAPFLVTGWRQPRVLVAMIIGVAAGMVDWVVEAGLWFGGVGSRITLAGQEPPRFGLYFSLPMQLRVLSGPWYCEPSQCGNINDPALLVWWLALAGLVGIGLYAVWRLPDMKPSSVLAVATGAWSALCYVLFVPFGAPRYMLPTFALFAIVAADGVKWLVTVPNWRRAGLAIACVFLLTGVVTQHLVLTSEIANEASARPFIHKADYLKKLGIKPPCVIFSPSVAYYVGCAAPWSGGTISEVLARAPDGVRAWRKISLHGPVAHVWLPAR